MPVKLTPPPVQSMPSGRIQQLKLVDRPAPPPPPKPSMETELGPALHKPGFDNSAENIHSEVKVNGKVVARIYNSGAIEVAGAYADKLHTIRGLGTGEGLDHADMMLASLKDAFAEFGASFTKAGGRALNLYA